MKKKIFILAVLCALMLLLFPACEAEASGSLKSITHPYIAQYECKQATFGDEDLLEKYDYIRIVIVDREKLEINFKPKDGKARSMECAYELNKDTHELSAEIGILGYKFRQKTVVENGKFTISMPINGKQLIMNFQSM